MWSDWPRRLTNHTPLDSLVLILTCFVSSSSVCVSLLPRISETGCWRKRGIYRYALAISPKWDKCITHAALNTLIRSLSHSSCKRTRFPADTPRLRRYLRERQSVIFHSDSYLDDVLKWRWSLLFICGVLGMVSEGSRNSKTAFFERLKEQFAKKKKFQSLFIRLHVQSQKIFCPELSTKGVISHCAGQSFPCN